LDDRRKVFEIKRENNMNKKDLELLSQAARCIDDCLMIIYPEEFTYKDVNEAKKRFFENKGIISRTATMADSLRKLKEKIKKGG